MDASKREPGFSTSGDNGDHAAIDGPPNGEGLLLPGAQADR